MAVEIVGQPAFLYTGDGPYKEIPKRAIGVSPAEEILAWKDKHAGGRCLLVANGDSAQAADFSRVPSSGPERVWTIGLNKAWLLGKWDYNAMGDQRQFQFHEQERGPVDELDPLFTTHASGRKCGIRIQGKTSDLKYFSFDAVAGFYLNNTITSFGIQLAVWMGFKTVFLIGVDCKGRHFYGGPPVPEPKFSNQRETFGLFAGILRVTRPDIEIVNLNPESAVRVFLKRRFNVEFKP